MAAEQKLKEELERWLSDAKFCPGATAAVALADGSVLQAAAGVADRATGEKMRADTRLMTGSVGKTHCAFLALTLAERGLLKLDALAAPQIPAFGAAFAGSVPNLAGSVTLRQLLTHTSGIPDVSEQHAFWAAARETSDADAAARDHAWPLQGALGDRAQKPLFAPGTSFSYSDTNFMLMGLAVEAATGRDYYDVLRDEVLVPCGLRDTVPAASRGGVERLVSAAYSGLAAEPVCMPETVCEHGRMLYTPAFDRACGGLAATAADLALWTRLCYGESTPASVAMAQPTPQSPGRGIPDDGAYGMGTMVWSDAVGHSGWMPGFNSVVAYFPAQRAAVALLCNYDRACRRHPRDVARRLLRSVFPAEQDA